MKQLIKNVLYVACVALLSLGLVYLMFGLKTNAYSVLGAVVGAVATFLIPALFLRVKH